MKPKEILRAIESHLELKSIAIPMIKEDPEYLEGWGDGATVEMEGEPLTIYLKKKGDLETLAEELTHSVDIRSYVKVRKPAEYEDLFYNNVLKEALGYYGSKLISPKRKPISVRKELKKNIGKKNWEKLRGSYTYQQDLELDSRIWHEIGYDLGEKVYSYVKKTGKKEPALLLLIKNREKEKPFETYKRMLKKVTE